MNIAFSTIIRIGDRSLEFNFRKLPGDQAGYSADVTDHDGHRIFFGMYHDAAGSWRARGALIPLWITASENLIGQKVEEGIKQLSLELQWPG